MNRVYQRRNWKSLIPTTVRRCWLQRRFHWTTMKASSSVGILDGLFTWVYPHFLGWVCVCVCHGTTPSPASTCMQCIDIILSRCSLLSQSMVMRLQFSSSALASISFATFQSIYTYTHWDPLINNVMKISIIVNFIYNINWIWFGRVKFTFVHQLQIASDMYCCISVWNSQCTHTQHTYFNGVRLINDKYIIKMDRNRWWPCEHTH